MTYGVGDNCCKSEQSGKKQQRQSNCRRSTVNRERALWVKPQLEWAKMINMPANQYRAFKKAKHAESIIQFPL